MENPAKTSTDLAITEMKTHKPGGCVGIFFQLFEWKRRLSQKKLFPKKFLPQGSAEHCSKKFKAMEKMPSSKLHLISDENSRRFVNRQNDTTREHEMRAPTLVARLMGLESMPLVTRGIAKKASVSEYWNKGSYRDDRNFEKGSGTSDSRPQKLRKTDYSENRAVARVLSPSRKTHRQPKLPSPTNCPRFSSGRSVKRTSRLIDAASRILEPGLLAANRAKCAITHTNSRTYASSGGFPTERFEASPLDEHDSASSVAGATSCEISDSFPGTGRRSIDDGFVSEPAVRQYRNPSTSSHPRKLRRRGSSSSSFRHGNQPQTQTSPGREKFSARSEINNLRSGRVSLSANSREGSKDSDAFNRGFCSRRRPTVLTELQNSKFHSEKTIKKEREEPHPLLRTSVRKRRMIDRRLGLDPCSTNPSRAEIKLDSQGEAMGVSPTRPNDQIPSAMEGEIMNHKRRVSFQKQYGLSEDAIGALLEKKLIESSSREEDEIKAAASAKTAAAIILQELIATLNDDFPRSHDCSITKVNVDSNAKAGTEMSMRMSKNKNHFSPDGSSTNTRSRSKYSRSYISGSNAWTRLGSCLPGRKMIEDFVDEVEEWMSFTEICLNEMIELEMDQWTGKWTKFSFQGFETGAEIEQDILQLLVEEVLVDMSEIGKSSH